MNKPKSIQNDPFKSQKWDEITEGRNFNTCDIPTLTLLVNWYAVMEQCMDDISDENGVHVAYSNNLGDIKALPQISTMKQASAEIRALNKQLGINDTAVDVAPVKDTPLQLIMNRRKLENRAANS